MGISTVPITWNDTVFVDGDSIVAHGTSNAFRLADLPVIEAISVFQRSSGTVVSGRRPPAFYNTATNGAQISTVAGRVNLIASKNATKCIFVIGVNDVISSIALNTSLTNLVTVLNASAGAGLPTLVAGPLCIGEKWPTGQNANDAALDALDAGMASTCAGYANAIYLSLRTLLYAAQEPKLNTPSPGTQSGPLTKPDGLFVHGNSLARVFYRDLILSKLSFVI